MDNNVLTAKISASPTDSAWSQAYSTLNLYIVLSLKSKSDEDLLNAGKELFEKIQREYFSLDQKDLKSIKTSIENAIGDFAPDKDISLLLATLKDNVLYIVTAGESEAVLKRGDKMGTIAKGEENQVIAFSGELKSGDVVILQTSAFANKVTTDKLSEALKAESITDASENLTPIIHEESVGTEAALILSYKGSQETEQTEKDSSLPQEENTTDYMPSESETSASDYIMEDEIRESEQKSKKPSLPKLPTIAIPNFRKLSKRNIIILAIVILAAVLLTSIYIEGKRQENARADAALEEVLGPANEQFEEAITLLSLNESLALEDFEEIKARLEEARGDFPEGSEQRRKLDEFIGKVESEIGKISGGATVTNQKELTDGVKIAIYRDGNLISVGADGAVKLLNSDGETQDELETENENPIAVTASDSSIYIFGDSGITRTTISNGDTEVAVEDPDGTISIDLFGSNIYGLNTETNSVDKYSGASFSQSDYLTGDIKLSNPVSMAIDGSIWVIDDGAIRKFTRGAEDSFEVNGLSLSNDSLIFTSVDYANLYVVDKKAAKIFIISKNGDIENQYSWSTLADAGSISADEENNTIYITSGDKLYSFEF